MDVAEKQYKDSEHGAIQYLRDDAALDLDGATARPDPSVEGVWEVTLRDGRRAIVYLAGYRDPWGRERQWNDFELEEE